MLSILGAIVIIIRKILNPSMAIGWPSMMVALCFFGGLIMLFLGLIGEYLGRMFLGMNRNPQFVIRDIITHENADHHHQIHQMVKQYKETREESSNP